MRLDMTFKKVTQAAGEDRSGSVRPEHREEEGRSGVGRTPRGKTQAPCRAGQRHGCSPGGLHGGTAPTLVTAPRVVGEVLQGQGDRGP